MVFRTLKVAKPYLPFWAPGVCVMPSSPTVSQHNFRTLLGSATASSWTRWRRRPQNRAAAPCPRRQRRWLRHRPRRRRPRRQRRRPRRTRRRPQRWWRRPRQRGRRRQRRWGGRDLYGVDILWVHDLNWWLVISRLGVIHVLSILQTTNINCHIYIIFTNFWIDTQVPILSERHLRGVYGHVLQSCRMVHAAVQQQEKHLNVAFGSLRWIRSCEVSSQNS